MDRPDFVGSNRWVAWAIGGSMLVHGAVFALWQAGVLTKAVVAPEKQRMTAVLVPKPVPPPPPAPMEAPPAPTEPPPPAPPPTITPKPAAAPDPKPQPKLAEPPKSAAPLQSEVPAPAPAVIALAPTPSATPPATTAPAPSAPVAPTKPGEPTASGEDEDAARRGYLGQLVAIASKYKRYPADAMNNGMQGVSRVTLRIGVDGMIAEISTGTSSGHDILDEQARITINKAKGLVPIPPALKGKTFTVTIPVVFRLDQ